MSYCNVLIKFLFLALSFILFSCALPDLSRYRCNDVKNSRDPVCANQNNDCNVYFINGLPTACAPTHLFSYYCNVKNWRHPACDSKSVQLGYCKDKGRVHESCSPIRRNFPTYDCDNGYTLRASFSFTGYDGDYVNWSLYNEYTVFEMAPMAGVTKLKYQKGTSAIERNANFDLFLDVIVAAPSYDPIKIETVCRRVPQKSEYR